MAYASISDVQTRLGRTLSTEEQNICNAHLNDAAVLIDAAKESATDEAKLVVSCRMVIRAMGDGASSGVPMGATQGSMSALGYSQSWTIGSGGSMGEVYLSKTDRQILGMGNAVGSYSPVEQFAGDIE